MKKKIKINSADDFSYKVKNDGITITGLRTGDRDEVKDIVIPGEIEGEYYARLVHAFRNKPCVNSA